MNRPSASERPSITSSPERRSFSQSAGRAGRAARLRRLPAMDLIGASELLISWPSTRTSRCHAERSSARSTRLRSEMTSSWCGRPSWRKVPLRTSQRPAPPGKVASKVRGLSPSSQIAESERVRRPAQQPLGGLAQQPLAAPVHQPQPAVAVEGEHRHVDLLDHPPEQRGGLQLPESLPPERLAQRVHFQQRETERVVGIGAAGPDGVVAFAQRGEEVGDGLERTDDALAQEERAEQPGADREQGEGEPDSQRVVAGPEQPARDQRSPAGRRRGRR